MTKNKIIAIVVAAVVVISGAVTTALIIHQTSLDTQVESTTEPTSQVAATAVSEPERENTTVIETMTDEEGNPVTGENGAVSTTIRDVVRTVAGSTKKKTGNTTSKSKTTTKKSNKKGANTGNSLLDKGLNQMEEAAVLGYSYNSEGDYFYTDDKNCWQSNFGYNEVYDQLAPVGCMFIDDIRVRFDYGGESWMIQLWKGQYGWLFVGAEIGVYTTSDFTTADSSQSDISHYNCAEKSNWLNMKMDLYWDDDQDGKYTKQFTRPYGKYWWITGFKLGTVNRFSSPIKELIMNARITFKDSTQATLFTKGMKQAGFKSASSTKPGNDSIYQTGSDVYFKWYSIYSNYVDQVDERHSSQSERTAASTVTTPSTAPEDEKPD